MDPMAVHPIDGDKYAIDIREHQVRVDQPLDAGGDDTAPTPTELFEAIKWAGFAYLAFMALQALRSAAAGRYLPLDDEKNNA
jgi:hypothetical protein